MRGNNVLGLIFADTYGSSIRELIAKRTMASVPIGARYRMIDFTLSNMVNSGINKVGVIAQNNYHSLMDHLGSGKSWDLSKKRDGLFILPPFGNSKYAFGNRLQTLASIIGFLDKSKEEYVLLSDCDVLYNIDLKNVIASHINNDADITMISKYDFVPMGMNEPVVFSMTSDNCIEEIIIDPQDKKKKYNKFLNIMLADRKILISLVKNCISRNMTDFKRDLIQKSVNHFKIYGYDFHGYARTIASIEDYYRANMEIMDFKVRKELFDDLRPIYTKVRDDMPTRYGLGCNVNNALIANGCVLEGEISNSVLFRGVHVEKNTKISNCVVMQDSYICRGSQLQYVISDKDVVIEENRSLKGFFSYPMYITKGKRL